MRGLPLVPGEFQVFRKVVRLYGFPIRLARFIASRNSFVNCFTCHVRLAGFFSLIVVLYRAHSLPPFGWMVQPSERISIDWLKGGNFAICLFFPFFPEASVMSKTGYLSSCNERHVEHIVHTLFAGLAHCVAFSLLLQRGLPSANETWRQITPEIQVFRLLFGWLMVDLPNLSALPETGM